MAQRKEIPTLSTQDLWIRYVKGDQRLDEYFREKPEAFLITRLEETTPLMNLPTEPHRRDVHEFVFVTKGSVRRSADLNEIEIRKGDIHLTLANQINSVEFLSEGLNGFYCHFSLDTMIRLYQKEHMVNELEMLSTYMQTQPVHLNKRRLEAVTMIFERLIDEYQHTNDMSLINAYLVTLCYEIKNAIVGSVRIDQKSKAFEKTAGFKQLIVKHIHEDRSIGFYARKLGITPNHLNKVVKQTTGKQASYLIAEMLVLEAKVLLKHSSLSVSEIGFRLGFVDQSYFSRFFKLHCGLTPREYQSAE